MAIEPGRLPPSNRLGKGHGWKSTLTPHLDPKTPTHLDYFGPLVIRTRFFHRLRTTSEYVLEETLVRPTTQEVFAQRHESGEVGSGVGCEVMELCPKEVQKPPKEKIRRQRKTAIYMGG